jgi:hypothetical protein
MPYRASSPESTFRSPVSDFDDLIPDDLGRRPQDRTAALYWPRRVIHSAMTVSSVARTSWPPRHRPPDPAQDARSFRRAERSFTTAQAVSWRIRCCMRRRGCHVARFDRGSDRAQSASTESRARTPVRSEQPNTNVYEDVVQRCRLRLDRSHPCSSSSFSSSSVRVT